MKFLSPLMRLMNMLFWDIGQFRHPGFNKTSGLIKALALGGRVEDAKIRRSVRTGRSPPLPAAVVGRQITIEQLRHEIALTFAPVRSEERRVGKECRSRWS